jgi:hypothetical protein
VALRKRIPRREPVPSRMPPPQPEPGDRVRLRTTGARGTVIRARGESVVLEMDEAFPVAGFSQRRYYSYPGELELIPRVGKMGSETLYAEEAGELPEQ